MGQRGDYYYVTQMVTVMENGRQVTRPQQVQKIRWSTVRGHVQNRFDDVLVCASESVPPKLVKKLEPWDLHSLTPFSEKYLSGFITEKYQVDLEGGFTRARTIMDQHIHRSILRDIGGDRQRVLQHKTQIANVTFKHLLLPAYISAYRFKNKLYRFLVNARTGEVTGGAADQQGQSGHCRYPGHHSSCVVVLFRRGKQHGKLLEQ